MINSKDILCVIVLYKSIYNECKTYRTFIQKNKDINVYICDNSPCRQICEDYTVVKYDHSSFNLGLSKSYNKACDYAKINNYNWILLLDQDTDFSNVSIKDYIDVINSDKEVSLIAPLVKCGDKFMSPINLNNRFPHLESKIPQGKIMSLFDYSPINSGICVSVDAFIKSGGYDNNVFLDYSDYIFIKRFRKIYDCFYLLDKIVYQTLSVISDDKKQTMNRYKLFCSSIHNISKDNITEQVYYGLIVVKRCISIMLKNKCYGSWKICYKYLTHKL